MESILQIQTLIHYGIPASQAAGLSPVQERQRGRHLQCSTHQGSSRPGQRRPAGPSLRLRHLPRVRAAHQEDLHQHSRGELPHGTGVCGRQKGTSFPSEPSPRSHCHHRLASAQGACCSCVVAGTPVCPCHQGRHACALAAVVTCNTARGHTCCKQLQHLPTTVPGRRGRPRLQAVVAGAARARSGSGRQAP